MPLKGSHCGEEYFLKPTSVIGVGFGPVTTGCDPYGMCSVTPAGISFAGDVESAISVEGSAGQAGIASEIRDIVQVETSLGIPVIEVVRGEQAMSLRAHVAELQLQVAPKLPLDRQVVLAEYCDRMCG